MYLLTLCQNYRSAYSMMSNSQQSMAYQPYAGSDTSDNISLSIISASEYIVSIYIYNILIKLN